MAALSFLAIVSLYAHLPMPSFARIHPAYSQEPQACNSTSLNPTWMATIPDTRPIQLLSIPGTHDSLSRFGTTKFMLKFVYETQTMELAAQLEGGIRALDIRCRHEDNECKVYHQSIYQKITLAEVITICQQFLKRNPSEAILMRVKNKEAPTLRSNRTFEETFQEYWHNGKYEGLFWKPTATSLDEKVPPLPLGQVRGRIVLLQYFDSKQPYGIPFGESGKHMSKWKQVSRATLYLKWTQVRDQLYAANESASLYFDSGPFNPNQPFYTNWLSGSLTVEPFFVASGHQEWGTNGEPLVCSKHFFGSDNVFPEFPRSETIHSGWISYKNVYCEGTNVMTYDRLKAQRFRFIGILYTDFIGCGLINQIIEVNKHF